MEMPVFITGNPSKAEQLSRHLGIRLKHQSVDLLEVQSLSLPEVVEHKARAAYEVIQAPVLVEDTALVFTALGKLPGTLVKWFLTELDNDGLCHLLDGYDNRTAVAATLFGYYDGTVLHTFSGEMEGKITDRPIGERGFGWDPIFIPKGYIKTWAEMSNEEQAETSMRKIALHKLEKYLRKIQEPSRV